MNEHLPESLAVTLAMLLRTEERHGKDVLAEKR